MLHSDTSRDDFERRLRRIDKAHGKGHAFAAKGTIRTAMPRQHGRWLRRAAGVFLVLLVTGIFLKAAILLSYGEARYQNRIDILQAGAPVDRHLSVLLQLDPLTRQAAQILAAVFP